MKKKGKLKVFKEVYKDPERKALTKIFYEFFYLLIIDKQYPGHYFSRYLFKKDRVNFKDFFPNSFFANNLRYLNVDGATFVVQNKLFFDFFYRSLDIPIPNTVMYNHNKIFVYKNNNFELNNVSDFIKKLKEVFKDISNKEAIIIKKTYESYGGKGIYKLTYDDIDKNQEKVKDIYSNIINSAFIFQEIVKQHNDLNKLNPSCLNTVRIDTYTDKDNNTEILSAYIRMSYTNSFVDNISSGGCSVGVDLATGKLKKNGYKTIHGGIDYLTEHPITKVKFENYQLPFFEEAKKMVLKTASLIPELKSVGWDIGFSETGPVLIEGNSNYNAAGNDLTYGGYKSHPVFQKVIKELKERGN